MLAACMRVYPRVCGGTCHSLSGVQDQVGLSPRVRGNLEVYVDEDDWTWSIPACAGEPVSAGGAHVHSRVYPRVCGGTKS